MGSVVVSDAMLYVWICFFYRQQGPKEYFVEVSTNNLMDKFIVIRLFIINCDTIKQ